MKQRLAMIVFWVVTILTGPAPAVADGLAVGVPSEDIGTVADGGAVNVLYGTASGLTDIDSQMWNQNSAGIPGMAEEDDMFGAALASGDFNGDGRADLAIGVPYEGVSDVTFSGLVHVLYADSSGLLTADGHQWWWQGLNGLPETVEAWDGFGKALAAGDFNGDGYDDLAVGVPGEDLEAAINAGAVHVIYGSGAGLTSTGSQFWNQGTPGIQGELEELDCFGWQLAAGDFDNDGYTDLAISAYNEEVAGQTSAGAVHVLYGSPSGITADDNGLLTDPWAVQEWSGFGTSLAAGDLNGDGCDDLAIGSPTRDSSGVLDAGWVTTLFGGPGGISTFGFQTLAQGVDCQGYLIQDTPEEYDQFGVALAIGDFDGDTYGDLAVGAGLEDLGSIEDAGVVHILFGTATGLTGENNQLWQQTSANVWGEAEFQDYFGWALAAGDFDDDGRDDLAVGAPGEGFDSLEHPGLVHIFRGGPNGPSSGLEVWTQWDVPGGPEDRDFFGSPLAVLHSGFAGLFADGFESGDLSAWD